MVTQLLRVTLILLIPLCFTSCKPQLDIKSFDGDRAYQYLVEQCNFGPRVPNSTAHAKALSWYISYFDSLGLKIEKQQFAIKDPYSADSLRLTNLIVKFNPELKNRILLCAHWDSRPRSDQDPDTSKRSLPLPGANDGASGVAVLMELASVLKGSNVNTGVDFALLDGEDWGKSGDVDYYCLGSKELARNVDKSQYDFAVILDMVGDKDQKFYKEGLSVRYFPELVEQIWTRAAKIGLESYFDKRVTEPVYDDHVPLLAASLRAIDMIDFEYPAWHTNSDTPDKCSAESLDHVGTLMLSLILDRL